MLLVNHLQMSVHVCLCVHLFCCIPAAWPTPSVLTPDWLMRTMSGEASLGPLWGFTSKTWTGYFFKTGIEPWLGLQGCVGLALIFDTNCIMESIQSMPAYSRTHCPYLFESNTQLLAQCWDIIWTGFKPPASGQAFYLTDTFAFTLHLDWFFKIPQLRIELDSSLWLQGSSVFRKFWIFLANKCSPYVWETFDVICVC